MIKKYILFSIAFTSLLFAQESWESLNGPYGGYFNYIATGNNNRIYAGLELGGAYFSDNSGQEWTKLFIDSVDVTVTGIAVNSDNKIFAATLAGIFKSTDDGQTWENNFNYQAGFLSIAIHNDIIFTGTIGKLFRSTDSGDTWNIVFEGFNIYHIFDIYITSDWIIYITTYQEQNGLYRSTDLGENWEQLNYGEQSRSLDVELNSIGDIFVCTWGNLLRSTDGGYNWLPVFGSSGDIVVKCIVIDKNDHIYIGTGGNFYLSGNGIYKSTDNGQNWNQINEGISNFNITSITVDDFDNLFAGTHGQLFRSNDYGENWEVSQNGIAGSDVRSIIKSEGIIFTATNGSGINIFNNNKWQQKSRGLPINFITDLIRDSNGVFYCGIYNYGIYKSNDNCENWEAVNNDSLDKRVDRLYLYKNNSILAGTSAGVYISSNGGENWIFIGPELIHVQALLVSENAIYAGTVFNGLFKTTNEGISWSNLSNGINEQQIRALAQNNKYLFIGTGASGGVYRSSNKGLNWEYLNNGLDSAGMTCLISGDLDLVFAGTTGNSSGIEKGVFKSNNNGTIWQEFNHGLRNYRIATFCISDGILYAGTIGSGIMSADYLTSVEDNINFHSPDLYSLFQNYPNPFNPLTIIKYRISHNEFVTMKIYDILGNEIVELVNELKDAGDYQITWNASDYPSGVYFCRMSAGEFTSTTKLLLMK
jgi:photosystem II stability/assembly factor-like uncharacterized protein